jgi:hypothetical protein
MTEEPKLPKEFDEWLTENRIFINRPTITSLLYDINLLPEQVITLRSHKSMGYLVQVVEHFKRFEKEVREDGLGGSDFTKE